MKIILLALSLLITSLQCLADSRVFNLVNPRPEEVLEALRNTYGDKIQADIVQGKLLVVGSKQQLDEIGALLVKLDPSPRALRLTLREQPPSAEDRNTITYSTEKSGYTIDTVEGAFVAIDYQKISQRPSGNGWWIAIDDVPTQFDSLTLQVKTEGGRRAIVLVSYAKQDNQQRRVFGNTVTGNLGTWIPLLPRRPDTEDGSISSGTKAGEQLYLRVERDYESGRRR